MCRRCLQVAKAGSQLLEELAEWVACQMSPRADSACTAAMARELGGLAAAEVGPDGLPLGTPLRPSSSSRVSSAPTSTPGSGHYPHAATSDWHMLLQDDCQG